VATGRGSAPATFEATGTLAFESNVAVDEHSLFRIYSMTKPVTGVAAMLLIEQGKLQLDQPLADFLPAFASMAVLVDPAKDLTSRPARTQITIRHLLTHTAGFIYALGSRGPLAKAYTENGINPAQVSRMQAPGVPTPPPTPDFATFIDRVASLPLIAEPGTLWRYSISLDILGRVIELASGKDLETFLRSEIFSPLDMRSTFFRVPQSEAHRLTSNYAAYQGQLFPIDSGPESIYLDKPPFPFGGTGLVSSARDYDRFLAMLLNGGRLGNVRILSKRTVGLALSNLLPSQVKTSGTIIDGWGFGAGGRTGLGTAAGRFGWDGAAGTMGFIDARLKLRATGLVQYMPSEAFGFQKKFETAVLTAAHG
jgi:CubicO group peptidase (beta-lactamase class C family)